MRWWEILEYRLDNIVYRLFQTQKFIWTTGADHEVVAEDDYEKATSH